MYSGEKIYLSTDEYLRDITGCTYREVDSDKYMLRGLGIILGSLLLAQTLLDCIGPDANIILYLLITFSPVGVIYASYRIFKHMTSDPEGEESYCTIQGSGGGH